MIQTLLNQFESCSGLQWILDQVFYDSCFMSLEGRTWPIADQDQNQDPPGGSETQIIKVRCIFKHATLEQIEKDLVN